MRRSLKPMRASVTNGPGALGRRVARRFTKGGTHPAVRALAERMGVKIAEEATPPPSEARLRSEYQAVPARIILYRDPLARLRAAVQVSQRFDMLQCEVEEVHIAHELFHHLQHGERFGPLGRAEEEEAAHAFAQELLGLEFHPCEFSALVDQE